MHAVFVVENLAKENMQVELVGGGGPWVMGDG